MNSIQSIFRRNSFSDLHDSDQESEKKLNLTQIENRAHDESMIFGDEEKITQASSINFSLQMQSSQLKNLKRLYEQKEELEQGIVKKSMLFKCTKHKSKEVEKIEARVRKKMAFWNFLMPGRREQASKTT